MPAPDVATIQALRIDVALQIARFMLRRGLTQLAALSLELLIRIAVRAGLPVVLQTGQIPEEAGAFVSSERAPTRSKAGSALTDTARASLVERTRRLTPEQRLAAFFEHTQLVSALHQAGHVPPATRVRKARRAS